MRFHPAGILIAPMLALSACGTHASSTAAFCAGIDRAMVAFAGLQDQPTRPGIRKAARDIQLLAQRAPPGLESAMKAEASAYREWAKTGDEAALAQNSFTVANDKLVVWLHQNCKHH